MFNILCLILIGQTGANLLPFDAVRKMADRFVNQNMGSYADREFLTYYGFDGAPNAYAFVYQNGQGEPLTLVAGARRDCTPIAEFSKTEPNYYRNLEKASAAARKYAERGVEFHGIYYYGPCEEYYGFMSNGREIMVNTYSLQVYDKAFFTRGQPERDPALEKVLGAKWDQYLSGDFGGSRYTGYVDSVPYIIWSYGCSPTASSMVFWYWDSRGYARLVDHFYDRWDNVEQGNDYHLPNVHRELAVAMNTDSMNTGGTNIYSIAPGHNTVANTQHGYTFTNTMSPQGNSTNQYIFSYVKAQIDAQRPLNWSILEYYYGGQFIGHSTTGIGYDIILPDTFVVLHNTWDTSEHSWALWTYYGGIYSRDYAYPSVPGGAVAVDLDLIFPSDLNTWLFRNLKYKYKWTSVGTIDHIKMWRAPGVLWYSNDTTHWQVMENSIPNTGSYIYTVPDESLYHRINLVGLNASNVRVAADGGFGPFSTRPVISTNPLIHLFGHGILAGSSQDIVVIGSYAYLAMNGGTIAVVNVADSSLPDVVNLVNVGGAPKSLVSANGYLYCATNSDNRFIVLSLTNPTSPTVIGSVTLPAPTNGIAVRGNYAYVTASASGLRVVSVANPATPTEIGYYNTPGQSYDVCLINDTIACVADGTRDLIFIKVSNPALPESLTSMRTPGIPKGVYFNGYLFVGDGPGGVGVVDVANPALPDSVIWFDTPGQPYKCLRQGNQLVVNDGPSGIHFYNIANITSPTDLGYLDSYGNANNCVMSGGNIAVADGDDGLYLIGPPLGILENSAGGAKKALLGFSSNPFRNQVKIVCGIGSSAASAGLKIYDASGQLVRDLSSRLTGRIPAVTWNGQDDNGRSLPAGIYFLRLQTPTVTEVQKLILVR